MQITQWTFNSQLIIQLFANGNLNQIKSDQVQKLQIAVLNFANFLPE